MNWLIYGYNPEIFSNPIFVLAMDGFIIFGLVVLIIFFIIERREKKGN